MQQDEWPTDVSGRVNARVLAWVFAFGLIATDAAIAARLVDVRIGTHPGYARVVLETDAPATHDLVAEPDATPGEVVVRITATSVARTLPARGGAPAVVIEPQADATTLARIRAAGPVRVETQVLRAPPRFVFDLRAGEPVAASVAEPSVEPVVEAVAEPAAETEPAPLPEVEVVAAEPELLSAAEAATPPEAEPAAADPAPMPVLPPAEAPALAVEPEPVPVPPAPPLDPVVEAAEVPEAALPPAAVEAPARARETSDGFDLPDALDPPAVSAPPGLTLGLEPRSLAVGAALGIGLALLGIAALRERRAVPLPVSDEPAPRWPVPLPPIEPRAIGIDAAAVAAAPQAELPAPRVPVDASDEPELAEDLVRMHRRLDARLAEVASRLDAIAARQGELDRHEGTQTHEIAAQRAAIARLQRAVPPPPRPRQTGKDPA